LALKYIFAPIEASDCLSPAAVHILAAYASARQFLGLQSLHSWLDTAVLLYCSFSSENLCTSLCKPVQRFSAVVPEFLHCYLVLAEGLPSSSFLQVAVMTLIQGAVMNSEK
jgi:hypothetical protein